MEETPVRAACHKSVGCYLQLADWQHVHCWRHSHLRVDLIAAVAISAPLKQTPPIHLPHYFQRGALASSCGATGIDPYFDYQRAFLSFYFLLAQEFAGTGSSDSGDGLHLFPAFRDVTVVTEIGYLGSIYTQKLSCATNQGFFLFLQEPIVKR